MSQTFNDNEPGPNDLISDDALARWLGSQANRRGCIAAGRCLVERAVLPAYEEGAALPESVVVRVRLTDTLRRAWVRRLEAVAAAASATPRGRRELPPLPVRIVRIVQRSDVGTATRYDLTLADQDGETLLQDLRAMDLLTWHRLRPIAFDARMVLPPLSKGQAALWHDEIGQAMRSAEHASLCDEESEAMEIRGILRDLSESARGWAWSEEDPYPRGVARIEHNGAVGWPRGPLLKEVRAQMGKVSRVALRRARVDLGWNAADWRIETAYIRVWAGKVKP